MFCYVVFVVVCLEKEGEKNFVKRCFDVIVYFFDIIVINFEIVEN